MLTFADRCVTDRQKINHSCEFQQPNKRTELVAVKANLLNRTDLPKQRDNTATCNQQTCVILD